MEHRDGFDDRLRQARNRQGLDPDPAKGKGSLPTGPWGIGFRAGVEVVSALVVGVALGFGLDRWLGTFPWLFLVFFVVGGAAGVLNIYRLFNPRPGARP
ncbi:AtpZ/AtpI family protein [Roseomonas xinghualingensis]|uniref:AtpZ/AtpI family protein n=1 Tax=Roseomonas xinghualingensis TaxID=2986475 RepID=UPI0021F11F42|nr:AtpZ/AtpI family protein [Roseomonas sp. SXEYE001]MCV4206202.1 AtpZ/AtpI family protein [Roseomonas sp. SXEYE001]